MGNGAFAELYLRARAENFPECLRRGFQTPCARPANFFNMQYFPASFFEAAREVFASPSRNPLPASMRLNAMEFWAERIFLRRPRAGARKKTSAQFPPVSRSKSFSDISGEAMRLVFLSACESSFFNGNWGFHIRLKPASQVRASVLCPDTKLSHCAMGVKLHFPFSAGRRSPE